MATPSEDPIQIPWQKKTLEELQQQLNQWQIPFDDTVAAPKHNNDKFAARKFRLIGMITLEEFRRRMSSFPGLDDTNDPDGKERKANFKLAIHYNVTRIKIRSKASREYYEQRLKVLVGFPQAWEEASENVLGMYERKMKAYVEDPVDDLCQSMPSFGPLSHSLFEGEFSEVAEHAEQDAQAKEIISSHFGYRFPKDSMISLTYQGASPDST